LLRTTELDETQRLYAERLMESGASLMEVLNDILDYSQIETGHLSVVSEPFDLEAVAISAVGLMSAGPESRGVKVSVLTTPEAKHIVGDKQRTRQILLNLFGNAVKFTEAGEIAVAITRVAGTDMVRIGVRDTGGGIPDDMQDTIFNEFVQVDRSPSRAKGGSGLGLAICKKLAEALGGEIGYSSKTGIGSEFWFTLPMAGSEPKLG